MEPKEFVTYALLGAGVIGMIYITVRTFYLSKKIAKLNIEIARAYEKAREKQIPLPVKARKKPNAKSK